MMHSLSIHACNVVEQICSLLPSEEDQQCKAYMPVVIVSVIDAIKSTVTPQEVCTYAGEDRAPAC